MPQQPIRIAIVLAVAALTPATNIFAQASESNEVQSAQSAAAVKLPALPVPAEDRVDVVTTDRPQHRSKCRVQAITEDGLVCTRPFGRSHTYHPQQILALIWPGEDKLRLQLLLGFNAGAGAVIWGSVVLAAACPPCAVATSVVALLLLGAAGAVLMGDYPPDHLIYLAPGQQLTGDLRSIRQ